MTTSSARADLLRGHGRVERDLTAFAELSEAASERDRERLLAHIALSERDGRDLLDRYLASVPRVRVSRCPITEAVLELPIDTAGLDGLWWRYAAPARPPSDPPPSLRAIVGALRLDAGVERTDFLVFPGPGAPYVLPRLLADERTFAVISQVAIGRHTGYAIAYFAPPPAAPGYVNAWGASGYALRLPDGRRGWGTRGEDEDERDFELAPWIERRRLRWIAPGDASLGLRDTVAGCPFLGLEGPRSLQRIQYGRSWP